MLVWRRDDINKPATVRSPLVSVFAQVLPLSFTFPWCPKYVNAFGMNTSAH